MSEASKKLETWEDVVISFFESRISKTKLFKARDYIRKKEQEILKEKDKKKLDRLIGSVEKKKNELVRLRKEAPSKEIRPWINETSKKRLTEGKKIIKATHVLKFSHSSSDPGGIELEGRINKPLLSTASFKKELTYDIAHSNGNLISISRFLALTLDGQQIIDLILNKDFSFLKPFSKDDKQLRAWEAGFSHLVEVRDIKTADKAKQIYFPKIEKPESNRDYMLLVPLFPSSFAEEIYSLVMAVKFGEEQKVIRNKKNRDNGEVTYHSGVYIDIPNLAELNYGGEYPRNISMLNANRSGQCFMLSTQPPTWQSQLTPPIYRKSLFSDFYNPAIRTEINYLRDFLLRFGKLDLSTKNPKRMQHLERWVNTIIDEFLFYIGNIQSLPSGWTNTEDINLKKRHQYLLDPYRTDEAFQSARQRSNWQTTVHADFAQWLNRQISGEGRQFKPQKEHTRLWKKLLEKPLREYMEPIEQEIKRHMRDSV